MHGLQGGLTLAVSRSDPFADPVLLGLGACVCGNEFCQPASGFYCVGTAPAFECSATPETTPYTTSRLMRKALM